MIVSGSNARAEGGDLMVRVLRFRNNVALGGHSTSRLPDLSKYFSGWRVLGGIGRLCLGRDPRSQTPGPVVHLSNQHVLLYRVDRANGWTGSTPGICCPVRDLSFDFLPQWNYGLGFASIHQHCMNFRWKIP